MAAMQTAPSNLIADQNDIVALGLHRPRAECKSHHTRSLLASGRAAIERQRYHPENPTVR